MERASCFFAALLLLPACGGPSISSETEDSSTAGSTVTDSGSSTTMGTGPTGSTTQGPATESATEAMTESTTEAPTTLDSTTDGFLQPMDMFQNECTTWDDTCPEGQKCMPYANDGGSLWNALGCFDIMGSGMVGDPCTAVESGVSGLDDCAQGHMCWNVEPDTLMGECIAFCSGNPEEPYCVPEMTTCHLASEGVLAPCLPACDLLVQDCSEDQACYVLNGTTTCAPVAVPEEQGNEGQPCEYVNACQAGLMCLNGNAWPGCGMAGCCAPYCDLNNPTCSEPGTECVALFENNPEPWMENYGVCAIPE
ncbi:MAG: hypothetical protein ACPG4T_24185 [Nannocystaceae bacterium]